MKMVELANKAAKIPFVKTLLKPIYYKYKEYLKRKEIRVFNKNGLRVIKEFDSVMTKGGYPYFLIFGSLLGAIREHGLIKHDFDLDVGLWYNDADDSLIDKLEMSGFILESSFKIDDGRTGMQWTVVKDGVNIDIFFIYPPISVYPYCCDFPLDYESTGCVTWTQMMAKYGGVTPRRVELPFSKDIIRVKFENLYLPIPLNAEQILRIHYGGDYMTPIQNWYRDEKDDPLKHLVKWNEKLAVYSEYHHKY